MVQRDSSLQLKLLRMPEFKHQTIDSLFSLAHIRHNIFVRPEVAKIIVDHYNECLPEAKHISITEMFQTPIKQAV